ncbi:phage baseplate assembly protein V [Neomegalonema sp.]|uniref:phage baseplate assembly protein V n=1 Tax=Neomegalonema sp. TaxID=2039713 RepID=UPI002610F03B|nr:phage baseplate assembly protein V [Neomegalonema sp.]MDD2870134.1 phage baseplate assembly protein V [Neomegalonema sp.]
MSKLRLGVVTEIDPAQAKARVRFPDHDGVVSWWLQVLQQRTKADKTYWMPAAGEHVVTLMDEHEEAGVVLGSIYSAADRPPVSDPQIHRIQYGDGASLTYDKGARAFTFVTGGTSVRISPEGVAVSGPSLAHNGVNVGADHVHAGVSRGDAKTDGPS